MKLSIRVGLLTLLAAVAGCGGGDRRAPVSGKVTVAGKGPLPGGNIRFVSAADPNRVGGGLIKADGTYEVPDAPVGACKVVIDNSYLDPSSKAAATMGGMAGMGGPGMGGMKGAPAGMPSAGAMAQAGPRKEDKAKMAEPLKGIDLPSEMLKGETSGQKFVKIDPAFGKPESTALTSDVQSGPNSKDFEVK